MDLAPDGQSADGALTETLAPSLPGGNGLNKPRRFAGASNLEVE